MPVPLARPLAALLLGSMGLAPAAGACDPQPGVVPARSWREAVRRYDAVFVARPMPGSGDGTTRAAVVRLWKGPMPAVVVFRPGRST